MAVLKQAIPNGFEPRLVREVLLRLHGIRPPVELDIPIFERNDSYIAARRAELQVLQGSLVVKTERWNKGWTMTHLLVELFMNGYRMIDCHVVWCGDNLDCPVTNISWRRNLAEHAVESPTRQWVANELVKAWLRGMMHLNPRIDGSYQVSIDLNHADQKSANMAPFPIAPFIGACTSADTSA